MNLYLRYFEDETLVHSVDEAIAFLSSINEIEITSQMIDDLKDYVNSSVFFPKRYKVRARVYFIVIKTEAATLQDFKDKKALRSNLSADAKNQEQMRLHEECEGWYEATLEFKRVVMNHVGKCEYRDTEFTAQCKAVSPAHCYERIKSYLEQRVDKRSQFPSVKGNCFKYKFLGKSK